VIRVRNLPSSAFILLLALCRFVICWIYCYIFIIFSSSLWSNITQFSIRNNQAELILIVYLAAVAGASCAAWWATLCNVRSQRIWVIAVSASYMATTALYVVVRPSVVHSPGQWSLFWVIALLGLAAFLAPHRVQISLNFSTYRLNSPDQKIKDLSVTF